MVDVELALEPRIHRLHERTITPMLQHPLDERYLSTLRILLDGFLSACNLKKEYAKDEHVDQRGRPARAYQLRSQVTHGVDHVCGLRVRPMVVHPC
uniref:Uncharacterized protein n=1 Tax=Triticum urartu TaxID=4572 RepID=A0A8R7QSI1_TRIUA